MTDYRSLYDRDYIGAWDLADKDVTVTIDRVIAGELQAPGTSKKNKKPVIYFRESREGKGFALNKTNGKTIAAMYGTKIEEWVGKRITIYATKTTFGADEVECIRVRPNIPPEPAK